MQLPDLPTGVERQRFEQVADILIPGCADRPSPSSLGLGYAPLDAVLRVRPDIAAPLRRALSVLGEAGLGEAGMETEQPDALMRRIADPDDCRALLLAAAGAYCSAPEVRRAIGYPGQQARVVTPLGIPDYIEEGLLDHVVAAD